MYNLSIIIPHYNSAEKLNRLLQSIPIKDAKVQVIVVDDKSDAAQIETLASQYMDKCANLVILQNDTAKKGAGVCRNLGLEQAKGKWILFADADDYFVSNFYETLEQYFDSAYDVVYFSPTSVEEDTMQLSDRHDQYEKLINDYLVDPNEQNELFLRYNFHVPWSKLYNREFLKKNQINFDETFVSNDLMFSTKTGYYMTSFKAAKEVIYCVTKNKGSLTTLISETVYDIRLAVFIDFCTFLFERLDTAQLKLLDVTGRFYLLSGIKQQFSLPKLLSIVYLMKKNKIRIIAWKNFNPVFVVKKLEELWSLYKNKKITQ